MTASDPGAILAWGLRSADPPSLRFSGLLSRTPLAHARIDVLARTWPVSGGRHSGSTDAIDNLTKAQGAGMRKIFVVALGVRSPTSRLCRHRRPWSPRVRRFAFGRSLALGLIVAAWASSSSPNERSGGRGQRSRNLRPGPGRLGPRMGLQSHRFHGRDPADYVAEIVGILALSLQLASSVNDLLWMPVAGCGLAGLVAGQFSLIEKRLRPSSGWPGHLAGAVWKLGPDWGAPSHAGDPSTEPFQGAPLDRDSVLLRGTVRRRP